MRGDSAAYVRRGFVAVTASAVALSALIAPAQGAPAGRPADSRCAGRIGKRGVHTDFGPGGAGCAGSLDARTNGISQAA